MLSALLRFPASISAGEKRRAFIRNARRSRSQPATDELTETRMKLNSLFANPDKPRIELVLPMAISAKINGNHTRE